MSVGVSVGNIKAMGIVSVTVDIASTGADSTSETDVTVRGVKVGDFVAVSKPSHTSDLVIGTARVKSDNTVAIQAIAHGTVNPSSETFLIFWARPEGTVSQVKE
jgi:hypothetical protein